MQKINSICIIDDDVITIYGIRKLLGSLVTCDDITSYENGRLALEGIQNEIAKKGKAPEIIFLDINMPIMDGWQFLEAFIAMPLKQQVRIEILTSSIDPIDKQNYERFKKLTHHKLTYNFKPLRKAKMEALLTMASE
ncbi:response regulator [Pricia sp. S334]|uniref:Response regulator n=1 Tax=Pricia mediterranea TaxID=3076079 RepID=A0ABU3L7E4_9FLAO|nr:response regulator [Pricia sp. S334]MDT7829661.1 response regulator [Pricia sp. S334]